MKERRAVVTGATGGIGQIVAETIAELGGNLVLVDLPGTDYQPLLNRLSEKWDINVDCIDCDLENDGARKCMIDNILQGSDALDVLVNNAAFVGTSELEGWVTDFSQQSTATWRRALEVNLTAVFDLCQGFGERLSRSKGTIINIASTYGVVAPDYSIYEGTAMGNPAAYAASKGGLIQLTRWLATTLAPSVRVNAISPGGVYRGQPPQFIERYEKKTPLQRMATESDFKGVVALLASNAGSYITGQNLLVDGGWSVW